MHAVVEKIDSLLQESDSNSLEWADGGGAEMAMEMLSALDEQGWLLIESLCSSRGPAWRACLASALEPRQGDVARRLMIELAWDQDIEVAFLATSGVAFYCGVNASENGPFIDFRILDSQFLMKARAAEGLSGQVREIGERCATHFEERFKLLAAHLESRF